LRVEFADSLTQQQGVAGSAGQAPKLANAPPQMWEAFDLSQLLALRGVLCRAASEAGSVAGGVRAFFDPSYNVGLARWRNAVNMPGPTAQGAESGGT